MSQPSSSSSPTPPRSPTAPLAAARRDAVDPDVDLHVPTQRSEWHRHRVLLPVIAVGGMLGASARYAAALAWPTPPHAMPWTTLAVNALGCLLIGMLMVFIEEVGGAHPLMRPFAGVGILGGFTTFSTYAVDTTSLVRAGRPILALSYAAGTLLLALVAVASGVLAARGVSRTARWRGRRQQPGDETGSHDVDDATGRDADRS